MSNRINHRVGSQTKQDKTVKELVVGKCWNYFNDNFHKFSEHNKIKIGLALCTKDMPTEVTGMNITQSVVMGEIKKNLKPMRFNIGSPIDDLEQRENVGVENSEQGQAEAVCQGQLQPGQEESVAEKE